MYDFMFVCETLAKYAAFLQIENLNSFQMSYETFELIC